MRIPILAPRRIASLVALALAIIVAPSTGHAQLLKKMKDAARKSATDVAADKVLGSDSSKAAGSTTAGAAAPKVARSSSQLEITTDRIDLMLAALEPLAAERERASKAAKAWAAYDSSRTKWSNCFTVSIQGNANAMALMAQQDEAGLEKANARMQQAADAMARAATANDTARMAVLQGEMEDAQYAMLAAQYPPVAKKCGASPGKRPTLGSKDAQPREADVQRIAQAGGMTRYQLGLMRERVAAWLLSDGALSGEYAGVKLADGEVQALTARKSQLGRYTVLFREDVMAWTRWYDLGTW